MKRNKNLDWIYESELLSPVEKQWYIEFYRRLDENKRIKGSVSTTGEEYEEDGE